MRRHISPVRWLIAPALLLSSCSRWAPPPLSGPSRNVAPAAAIETGRVAATAAGDVKLGTGVLEFVRLRMDRQASSGASIFAQYALPGGYYGMDPGETVELWAEWDPAGVPRNPRLIVDWGEGEADFTGCGSCKLNHRYNRGGVYNVVVRLTDLSGTTVTRTFTLDSRQPQAAPPTPPVAPSISLTVNRCMQTSTTDPVYGTVSGCLVWSLSASGAGTITGATSGSAPIISSALEASAVPGTITLTGTCGTATDTVSIAVLRVLVPCPPR